MEIKKLVGYYKKGQICPRELLENIDHTLLATYKEEENEMLELILFLADDKATQKEAILSANGSVMMSKLNKDIKIKKDKIIYSGQVIIPTNTYNSIVITSYDFEGSNTLEVMLCDYENHNELRLLYKI